MLYLNLQTQLKIDFYINAIQRINNRRPKVSELEFKVVRHIKLACFVIKYYNSFFV